MRKDEMERLIPLRNFTSYQTVTTFLINPKSFDPKRPTRPWARLAHRARLEFRRHPNVARSRAFWHYTSYWFYSPLVHARVP